MGTLFSEKAIQHGCQFVFDDGAILCAYETGKHNWQGKPTATRQRVAALLGESGQPVAVAAAAIQQMHQYSNQVFIVYGHDTDAREQLELLLRRLKLEPVVLQNRVQRKGR